MRKLFKLTVNLGFGGKLNGWEWDLGKKWDLDLEEPALQFETCFVIIAFVLDKVRNIDKMFATVCLIFCALLSFVDSSGKT